MLVTSPGGRAAKLKDRLRSISNQRAVSPGTTPEDAYRQKFMAGLGSSNQLRDSKSGKLLHMEGQAKEKSIDYAIVTTTENSTNSNLLRSSIKSHIPTAISNLIPVDPRIQSSQHQRLLIREGTFRRKGINIDKRDPMKDANSKRRVYRPLEKRMIDLSAELLHRTTLQSGGGGPTVPTSPHKQHAMIVQSAGHIGISPLDSPDRTRSSGMGFGVSRVQLPTDRAGRYRRETHLDPRERAGSIQVTAAVRRPPRGDIISRQRTINNAGSVVMSEEDSEVEEGSSLDAVLGASTIGDNGRGRPESGKADRKEREKISAFVQSEEIFNLIAHQRHLREEQRQITIREMRKQGLMNKIVRRAYEQAQIDLSQTEDHDRMTQINRAIFMGDRSLQEIKELGLEKRRRLFEDMEASTTDVLVHGDGKPISLSVHKEQEAAEARRKDRIARGYLLEREKDRLRDKRKGDQDTDTPNLRWKWAFEFGAGQKGVTQSTVQRDLLRLTKATRDHRFELHRFDNRMRANVGTLSGRVLGENWWARQLLDHRDPMHLEMWAKIHSRPPKTTAD